MDKANLVINLRVLAAGLALVAAIGGIAVAVIRYRYISRKLSDFESKAAHEFVQQFNKNELKRAVSGYVTPHCSPSDPSNKEGEEYLADTRENIFDFMDRTIEFPERSYNLILADTGMGKTLFCMNYFSHVKQKFSQYNASIVSLSVQDSISIIKGIPNKSDAILILDALDEDPRGFGRGGERLSEILEASADFRNVIITCRSQYFMSDDHIPRETPLPILVNRRLGQGQNYNLVRSYLAPFDQSEVRKYINSRFPLYKVWRIPARIRAMNLAEAIPDLAYRPMLLERLPELALTGGPEHELFDLYRLLIDGWLQRESRWIESGKLERVSIELAIEIYRNIDKTNGRVDADFIQRIAENNIGKNPEWSHLTSRSLLNRDSKGKFKFAHKSVLEFLVVKAAISGDIRPLSLLWTPFMKELFISWGYTASGKSNSSKAKGMLQNEDAKKNINPLFDSWLSAPVHGLPNFKRCAARKETAYGTRLMPPSWRGSTVEISERVNKDGFDVLDREFNLEWAFYPIKPGIPPMNLTQALKLNVDSESLSLPSYEQFVTLVEGLSRAGSMFLPPKRLFAVADQPGGRQTLLVELNSPPRSIPKTRLVDKERKISGTEHSVNTYLTQPDLSAHKLSVQQLWLIDRYKLL